MLLLKGGIAYFSMKSGEQDLGRWGFDAFSPPPGALRYRERSAHHCRSVQNSQKWNHPSQSQEAINIIACHLKQKVTLLVNNKAPTVTESYKAILFL